MSLNLLCFINNFALKKSFLLLINIAPPPDDVIILLILNLIQLIVQSEKTLITNSNKITKDQIKSIKNFVGMQKGDVYKTWADTKSLQNDFGYVSTVSLKKGISIFTDWYKKYYK